MLTYFKTLKRQYKNLLSQRKKIHFKFQNKNLKFNFSLICANLPKSFNLTKCNLGN